MLEFRNGARIPAALIWLALKGASLGRVAQDIGVSDIEMLHALNAIVLDGEVVPEVNPRLIQTTETGLLPWRRKDEEAE